MIISDNIKYKIVYLPPYPSINRCSNSVSNLKSASNSHRIILHHSPSLLFLLSLMGSDIIDTPCPNRLRASSSSSSSLNRSGKMLLPSHTAQIPGVATSCMQYAACTNSKQFLGRPHRQARPLLLRFPLRRRHPREL